MKYDPKIHHRKSIRLKNYDYSQVGSYFVTICTQQHEYLFGEIKNGGMVLNDAGKMIQTIWNELPQYHQNIKTDTFVIMPNHFHGIITVGADSISAQPADFISVQPAQPADFISVQPADSISAQSAQSANSADSADSTDSEKRAGKGAEMDSAPTVRKWAVKRVGKWAEMDFAPTISATISANVGADSISAQTSATVRADSISAPAHPTVSTVVQSFKRYTTIQYIKMVKQHILPRFNKRIWQRNFWEHIIRNENEYNRIMQYIIENPAKWENDKLNNGVDNKIMESITPYNNEIWMV